jgi:hypothetical protein
MNAGTIWLTEQTIFRLAAESCRSVATVKTVLRGGGNAQSREAVAQAARRLNVELPAPRAVQPGAPLGVDAHAVRSQAR